MCFQLTLRLSGCLFAWYISERLRHLREYLMTHNADAGLPNEVPELVRVLSENWVHYISTYSDAVNAVSELRARSNSKGLPGRQMWSWVPNEMSVRSMIDSALEAVVFMAAEVFCSGNPAVMSGEWLSDLKQSTIKDAKGGIVDFRSFWAAIEGRFGNGVGAIDAKRRAAVELNRLLRVVVRENGLQNRVFEEFSPKVVRGGIRFRYRPMIETRCDGRYAYRYDARRDIDSLNKLLVCVCGTDFPPPRLAELSSSFTGQVELPHSIDLDSWRITINKEKSYLWLPMDDALELRSAIEEMVDD